MSIRPPASFHPSGSYPPLYLTLRFPSDVPDLHLPVISNPALTTGLSLISQIRFSLPSKQASLRILLISAGQIVALKEPLSTSLRLNRSDTAVNLEDREGKGKAKASDTEREPEAVHRIIHATFSNPDNVLSEAELAAEEREGQELNNALSNASATPIGRDRLSSTSTASGQVQNGHQNQVLRGFSRLAATGIPEQDIAALRAEFRSLLADNTPDAAPLTPLELLTLEERWLDDAEEPTHSSDPNSSNSTGDFLPSLPTTIDTDGSGSGASSSSAINDILIGNILGFFWPLGALFWLARQDGIWRESRSAAVFVGMLVNFAFCLLREGVRGGVEASGAD